jgi:hypothetical protein
VVTLDNYQQQFLLDFKLTLYYYGLSPHSGYAQGDNQLLYNALRRSD